MGSSSTPVGIAPVGSASHAGASLQRQPSQQQQAGGGDDGEEPGECFSILKRWHVSVELQAVPGGAERRASHAHVSTSKGGLPAPQLQAMVQASPLVLHADWRTLEALSALATAACNYVRFCDSRRTRPQVRICECGCSGTRGRRGRGHTWARA